MGEYVMIRLVYVSKATNEMSSDLLMELLKQSREKNSRLGLSGMLLYGGGNFLQIIEGEKETVEALYEIILADKRHEECVLIDKSDIQERTFGEWSMGFELLKEEDISDIQGYTEFLTRAMRPKEIAIKPDNILGLLYSFKKSF